MAGRVAEKTSPARGVGCCQGGICRETGGLSPHWLGENQFFLNFTSIFPQFLYKSPHCFSPQIPPWMLLRRAAWGVLGVGLWPMMGRWECVGGLLGEENGLDRGAACAGRWKRCVGCLHAVSATLEAWFREGFRTVWGGCG